MSDIVERLTDYGPQRDCYARQLYDEAADEIERLRDALRSARRSALLEAADALAARVAKHDADYGGYIGQSSIWSEARMCERLIRSLADGEEKKG